MTGTQTIPYDQRLARIIVRPLTGTRVHPNHLTALSLVFGIAAALLFALGGVGAGVEHWAALVYMLAVFTDHTDGELARMTGKASDFGHAFDYIVGSANYTVLFIGLGVGLMATLGGWALALGLASGLANPLIVTLRMTMERRHGGASVEHPRGGGFEIEDFIYLIGPITWIGGVEYFFLLYSLGTLVYLGWTLWSFLVLGRASGPSGGQ